MKSRWTVIPAMLLVVFALLPQGLLWLNGGSFASYFVSNYDEPAYSAYVSALVEGKPRRFDPFLQDETNGESLYSVQFVPAYAVALPARWLGISTSTAFIVLIALIAVLSYAALVWLLNEITGSAAVAGVAAFAVLCLGTAVAFQGELRHLVAGSVLVDFFPFLRRYQPGVAFPLFFVFCVLAWKGVAAGSQRSRLLSAVGAGASFAVLVFSYFYLWTAAAAWLVCFVGLTAVLNKEMRGRAFILLSVVGAFAAAALVPYFQLLSHRAVNVDAVQLLDKSRAPYLASPVLIFGLLVAAAAMFLKVRSGEKRALPSWLFCVATALTPVVVLNQQIVTGMSLQPVHYEIFIGNYLVLTALGVLIFVILRDRGLLDKEDALARPLMFVLLAVGVWGLLESFNSAGRASAAASLRDRSVEAIKETASKPGPAGSAVLATNFVTADIMPTIAPVRPVWNAHSSSAGGIGTAENKRLFYLSLYYSGYTSADLAEELRARSFEVTAAVFGSERALPSLASRTGAITDADIRAEVADFDRFVSQLDAATAYSPLISHAIVPARDDFDMRPIDRWYTRDAGVKKGIFTVYKLTPKTGG